MVLDVLIIMAAGTIAVAGIVLGRAGLLSALALYSYLAAVRFVLRPAFVLLGFDDFARPELVNGFPREAAWTAVMVFIAGHTALIVGYLFYRRSVMVRTQLWRRRLSDNVSLQRVYLVAALLVGLNAVFWLDFLRTAGSIANMVRLSRLEFFDENSVVKSFPQWLIFFGVYIYLVSYRAPANRGQLRRVGGGSAVLGILMMASYGDRSSILMPLLVGIVAYHLAVKRVKVATLAVIGVSGIALLGVAGIVRVQLVSGADTITLGATPKQQRVAHYVTEGLNLDVFDTFVVVIDRFEEIDYRLGEDFALGVVGLVPRAVWPEKPSAITPGAWFRQKFMPEARGGRPFTNEGVWLINFGIVGVMLGLFITGCVLKELDLMGRSVLTVGQATLVCVLLFRVFLSGVSSLTILGLFRYAFPMILCMYFVTLPPRQANPPARGWLPLGSKPPRPAAPLPGPAR